MEVGGVLLSIRMVRGLYGNCMDPVRRGGGGVKEKEQADRQGQRDRGDKGEKAEWGEVNDYSRER